MKIIVIAGLISLTACAGGSYSTAGSVCGTIPYGIEAYQYLETKKQLPTCAEVEMCAQLHGAGAPPNTPCRD